MTLNKIVLTGGVLVGIRRPMKLVKHNVKSGPVKTLTTTEVSTLLGFPKWTIREMVKRGEVKRVMGIRTKEFRFLPDAFDHLFQQAA